MVGCFKELKVYLEPFDKEILYVVAKRAFYDIPFMDYVYTRKYLERLFGYNRDRSKEKIISFLIERLDPDFFFTHIYRIFFWYISGLK